MLPEGTRNSQGHQNVYHLQMYNLEIEPRYDRGRGGVNPVMPYATYAHEAGIQVKSVSFVNEWFLINGNPIELRQKFVEPLKISEKFCGEVNFLFGSVSAK